MGNERNYVAPPGSRLAKPDPDSITFIDGNNQASLNNIQYTANDQIRVRDSGNGTTESRLYDLQAA